MYRSPRPILADLRRIKVLIVGPSLLIREALRWRLGESQDFEVVGEESRVVDALAQIQRTRPGVVLLEVPVASRDGLGQTQSLAALPSSARVVVLTADAPWYLALRILRAGAQGLLFTTAGGEEVMKAIRSVSSGKVYLPQELEKLFAERHLLGYDGPPEELLSERELQVLSRLARGQTNREIARELYISVKTVDTHRASVLRKLGLRNNAELTRFAIQIGLL